MLLYGTYDSHIGVIPGEIRRIAELVDVAQTETACYRDEYSKAKHQDNSGFFAPRRLKSDDEWYRKD
jgi:hypothetical protein